LNNKRHYCFRLRRDSRRISIKW